MEEAGLSLNAAKAGMESTMSFTHSDTRSYEREEAKATINLLNFSALYATYIDICRRLRKYSGLEKSSAYNRAVSRIVSSNSGKHSFIKDLRNFILHHHLLQPSVTITYGRARTTALLIQSDALVIDGYNWKREARDFIQSNQEIELTDLTADISEDISRLVEFHEKLVGRYLKAEKSAYELYRYERSKVDYLAQLATNIEAAFKIRPRSLLSKIIDKKLLERLLSSSLTDDEIKEIIALFANRHKNLAPDMKVSIEREIENLLWSRPRFPKTKAYLAGREFPRNFPEVNPPPEEPLLVDTEGSQ